MNVGEGESIAYFSLRLALLQNENNDLLRSNYRAAFLPRSEPRGISAQTLLDQQRAKFAGGIRATFFAEVDLCGTTVRAGLCRLLDSFGRKQYWSRAWVVQELKLAKRVQILCGSHGMDLRHVRELVTMMLPQASARRHPMSTMFEAITSQAKIRLINELAWVASLACFDPRDRIYAMSRVFKWGQDRGPLIVDYTKPAIHLAVEMVDVLGQEVMEKGPDPYLLTANILSILELPHEYASKLKDFHQGARVPERLLAQPKVSQGTMCLCIDSASAQSSFRPFFRRSTFVGQLQDLLQPYDDEAHAIMGELSDEMFGAIFAEKTSPVLGLISANAQPTDRLVNISSTTSRFVVLRKTRTKIFEIVGLAIVCSESAPYGSESPFDHSSAQPTSGDRDIALFLDPEDAVNFVRSNCANCYKLHGTLIARLNRDSTDEDDVRRATDTCDQDWFRQQVFSKQRFSSFGLPKHMLSRDPRQLSWRADRFRLPHVCTRSGLWKVPAEDSQSRVDLRVDLRFEDNHDQNSQLNKPTRRLGSGMLTSPRLRALW